MTQPPPVPEDAQDGEGINVRFVASKQKALLVCILLYLLALLGQVAIPPRLHYILFMAGIALLIVAAVFVAQLGMRLYGKGPGIAFGILTLVPLVGLIVLLVVNAKATSVLKENGLKVGLLGAKVPNR
ncbi:MAG: hypothetical protein ACLFTN_09420 [Phycisphaerae bacterium]